MCIRDRFLGVESVRGGDGIGITVSYWRDRASIRNWRINVEHLAAQQMGRQEFYSWYHIRVAEVVAHRSFDAGDAVDPGTMPPDATPGTPSETPPETGAPGTEPTGGAV